MPESAQGRAGTGKPSADGAIPHVIHRVWPGSDAMPEEYRRYGESWARHHPEWEMRLWTDAHADELGCADAMARARTYVERSDLIRYEVLRRHGGVYVDTDFECLKPIDPLLAGVTAFAAYPRAGTSKVATGVMGCVPGHPAFERAAERVHEAVGLGRHGETGPDLMTEIVRERPDVTVFDAKLFYPYHWTELHLRDAEFPEAYGVHHWSLRFLEKLHRRHEEAVVRIEELEGRLARAIVRTDDQKRRRKAAEARVKELERTAWRRVSAAARRPFGRPERASDERDQ